MEGITDRPPATVALRVAAHEGDVELVDASSGAVLLEHLGVEHALFLAGGRGCRKGSEG